MAVVIDETGPHDDGSLLGENMHREEGLMQQQRLDFYEAERRLEQFARPQDIYQIEDPEDGHLDRQIRALRGWARQNGHAR